MFLIQSFHLMVLINMVLTPNATQLTFITEAHTHFYISLNVDCDVKTCTVVGVRGKRQENSPHHQQVHSIVCLTHWHLHGIRCTGDSLYLTTVFATERSQPHSICQKASGAPGLRAVQKAQAGMQCVPALPAMP